MKYAKKPGFSLIEAMVSLAATVLCVMLISNLFGCFKLLQAKPQKTISQDSEIFYGYAQLDHFLKKGAWCRIETNRSDHYHVVFTIKDKGQNGAKRTYVLSRYQQMLRLTNGQGRGHMPLIMKIKNASFSCTKTSILVNVKERDGRQTDLFFQVPPAPEESNEKIEQRSQAKKAKQAVKHKNEGQRPA